MTIRHSLATIFTGAVFAVSGPTLLSHVEGPNEIKLASERVEGPEGAVRITYEDLDLLRILPSWFSGWQTIMDGQRVRLRGYMRPGLESKDLPFFVLARDTRNVFFSFKPMPYDFIPVVLRNGATTDYIHLRPLDVVGVLHLEVMTDPLNEDEVWFVYHVDDAIVIEG